MVRKMVSWEIMSLQGFEVKDVDEIGGLLSI